LVLGFSAFVAIDAAEFHAIRDAKRRLMFGMGLEEKLDLVLENYSELERDLLNMALEHSIFQGKIDSLLDGGTHLVNRRIAKLLTTARLYLDQVLHNVSEIYGKNSESYDSIKKATNEEYDSVLGYRVMEALRNHAQHRSLPTHGISFPVNRDESSDPPNIRFRVVPSVDVAALEDDPKFKKQVLEELLAIADKNNFVNLMPFVRQYAESLGRIHEKVRDVTATNLGAADELIATYREKAANAFGPNLAGLIAVECDEQGVHEDREHLIDRPTKRRKDIARKNQRVGSISSRYISSSSA